MMRTASAAPTPKSMPVANAAAPPAKTPLEHGEAGYVPSSGEGSIELDYTRVPAELEAKLAALDVDAALRPTKILVQPSWTKRSQGALLGTPKTVAVGEDEQERERARTFDLLDALSRSGSLPIDSCALHVLIAATHCFDDSLIDTVIRKNVNPIEKLEMSTLVVSETIQAQPAAQMVLADAYERVAPFAAPALLPPRPAEP